MKFYFHIVCFLFMMVSCVERIDYDSIEDLPLSVHCILTEDESQTMEISRVKGYGNQPVSVPENLKVVIFNSLGDTSAVFKHESGTRWTADMKPDFNRQYRLSISIGDEEIIRAITTFPDNYKVMQFMKRRQGSFMENLYSSCELRLPDIDSNGKRNPMGKKYNKKATIWVFPKKGTYLSTTHPYADKFNQTVLRVSDLPCFSRDSILTWNLAYSQSKRWIKEWYSDLPLYNGFIRIPFPSNFNNGEDPEVIDPTPLYTERSFILITDYANKEIPTEGRLYSIYGVSEELDNYLKSVYEQQVNQGQDMRMIYHHDTYTNISGGLGVFGAVIKREDEHAIRGYNGDFMI